MNIKKKPRTIRGQEYRPLLSGCCIAWLIPETASGGVLALQNQQAEISAYDHFIDPFGPYVVDASIWDFTVIFRYFQVPVNFPD